MDSRPIIHGCMCSMVVCVVIVWSLVRHFGRSFHNSISIKLYVINHRIACFTQSHSHLSAQISHGSAQCHFQFPDRCQFLVQFITVQWFYNIINEILFVVQIVTLRKDRGREGVGRSRGQMLAVLDHIQGIGCQVECHVILHVIWHIYFYTGWPMILRVFVCHILLWCPIHGGRPYVFHSYQPLSPGPDIIRHLSYLTSYLSIDTRETVPFFIVYYY